MAYILEDRFFDHVKRQLDDIVGMLTNSRANPRKSDISRFEGYFDDLKREMDSFVESHRGSVAKSMYTNALIALLKNEIIRQVQSKVVPYRSLFGVAEAKFRELFGYDLNLPRTQPQPQDQGPSWTQHDRPTGPGSHRDLPPMGGGGLSESENQYIILRNLHSRLSALEQRMGV